MVLFQLKYFLLYKNMIDIIQNTLFAYEKIRYNEVKIQNNIK